MKTTLTVQESVTLISKGISHYRASAFDDIYLVIDGVPTFSPGTKQVFTLADLLSLLPKTINSGHYYFDLSYGFGDWTASYILWDDCDEGTYIRDTLGEKTSVELIDALYQLVLWCVEHKYIEV